MSQSPVDFLIVGAMKSGTTTLHSDLAEHPDIFLPANKEPMSFCSDDILTPKGLDRYRGLFARATYNQIVGEASTTYTMLPEFDNVVERVSRVIGTKLKIVYMVRDPIKRCESHVSHDVLAGRISANQADKMAIENEKYSSISSYYFQIRPWIDLLGEGNVKVVIFEEYFNNKHKILEEIFEFLGVDADFKPMNEKRLNTSENRLVPGNFVRRLITDADWYKNHVKPVVPARIKMYLSSLLQTRNTAEPVRLSKETKRLVANKVKPDMDLFTSLLLKRKVEAWAEFRHYSESNSDA